MRKFSQILLLFVLALSLTSQVTAQDNMSGPNVIVMLTPTPLAENAGLEGVTGWAHVNSPEGTLHIVLEPNGAMLPEGTVLEGWLVDAGLNGGPGESSVSDADEEFGTPFGNADFDAAVEGAPYALSTGILTPTMESTWEVVFEIPAYEFDPYDAVVITAESDGSAGNFDPRPGTPVFSGLIAEGEPAEEMMMGSMEEMEAPIVVQLSPTPLAENAGLAEATGTAMVYVYEGTVEITVELGGMDLPEGSVLEGWLVDAGLNGGPGMTNVTDDDEAYGTPFGNAEFDAAVESAPYALSTGVLSDDMGMLTLTFHVPAYNFSPYDAVVITLESDGNTIEGFDPRPGTPVLAGEIMMGEMMEDEMMMEDATSCSIES